MRLRDGASLMVLAPGVRWRFTRPIPFHRQLESAAGVDARLLLIAAAADALHERRVVDGAGKALGTHYVAEPVAALGILLIIIILTLLLYTPSRSPVYTPSRSPVNNNTNTSTLHALQKSFLKDAC